MHDFKKKYLDSLETSSIKDDSTYRLRSKDIKKFENLNIVNENVLNLEDKRIWVWSDTHFYHENIIKFCDRPFGNIYHMNNTLISNYNSVVKKDDVCIWVGDVALGPTLNYDEMNKILDMCHGYKILVIGNHDIGKWDRFNFQEKYVVYNYQNFLFTHYPWELVPKGYYNIHGHIHANPNPDVKLNNPRLFNVNCEFHDYQPISLNKIAENFNT